mgnify:CR=1 FL=1
MDGYYVIKSPGEGEYVDRKSRFIGHAMPVHGEEEALVLIDQVRRKYWDARHNCYGYVVGERGETTRFSDDGEPGGTAGRPILDVLTGSCLRDVLVVVTRYFGGTLLGTGGLVRAYTQATHEALDNADLRHLVRASRLRLITDYNNAGRLKHYFETGGIRMDDVIYTDKVENLITIPEEEVDAVMHRITDMTGGSAEVTIVGNGFFEIGNGHG